MSGVYILYNRVDGVVGGGDAELASRGDVVVSVRGVCTRKRRPLQERAWFE